MSQFARSKRSPPPMPPPLMPKTLPPQIFAPSSLTVPQPPLPPRYFMVSFRLCVCGGGGRRLGEVGGWAAGAGGCFFQLRERTQGTTISPCIILLFTLYTSAHNTTRHTLACVWVRVRVRVRPHRNARMENTLGKYQVSYLKTAVL